MKQLDLFAADNRRLQAEIERLRQQVEAVLEHTRESHRHAVRLQVKSGTNDTDFSIATGQIMQCTITEQQLENVLREQP